MQINIKTEKNEKTILHSTSYKFYEVETTAILAGSGESQNHVGNPSISVNGDVTCGDEDNVWD